MKTIISKLKKHDRFRFNGIIHVVTQKYSDWRKDNEPYLKTDCRNIFYNGELEVELIK
jgi:hypothetical protein